MVLARNIHAGTSVKLSRGPRTAGVIVPLRLPGGPSNPCLLAVVLLSHQEVVVPPLHREDPGGQQRVGKLGLRPMAKQYEIIRSFDVGRLKSDRISVIHLECHDPIIEIHLQGIGPAELSVGNKDKFLRSIRIENK